MTSVEEPLLKNRRNRQRQEDEISTTSSMSIGSGREEKEIQTTNTTSNTSTSIENICWLIAAVACAYFSDIFRVLYSDIRIYRYLALIRLFKIFEFSIRL